MRNTVLCSYFQYKTCSGDEYDDHRCRFSSADPRDALLELCVRLTCAAYFVYGMIQKAAEDDTSAAEFIKEMNGEGRFPVVR